MTNFAGVGVVATAQPAAANHWTNCDNAAVYCNARISKVSSTELKIVGNMSSYKRGDLEMHLSLYENGVPLGNWKRTRCFNATSCERTWILPLCKPGNRYEAYIEFRRRSEEHTSELQSLMRISYAVFCLKKKHT